MDYKEKVYFVVPIFIQNAMLSFYGLKLRRERYGKHLINKYKQLLDSQYWNISRLNDFQERVYSLRLYMLSNLFHIIKNIWVIITFKV